MVQIEDCNIKPIINALDNRLSSTEFAASTGISIGTELALHFLNIKTSKYVNDATAHIAAFEAGNY